jgi:hypothetical protein
MVIIRLFYLQTEHNFAQNTRFKYMRFHTEISMKPKSREDLRYMHLVKDLFLGGVILQILNNLDLDKIFRKAIKNEVRIWKYANRLTQKQIELNIAKAMNKKKVVNHGS